MGKMKSLLGLYAAMAAMGSDIGSTRHDTWDEPKETEEERTARLAKVETQRYKSQGLTQFFYGENSLWALNKKSADKKAKKRNWL